MLSTASGRCLVQQHQHERDAVRAQRVNTQRLIAACALSQACREPPQLYYQRLFVSYAGRRLMGRASASRSDHVEQQQAKGLDQHKGNGVCAQQVNTDGLIAA